MQKVNLDKQKFLIIHTQFSMNFMCQNKRLQTNYHSNISKPFNCIFFEIRIFYFLFKLVLKIVYNSMRVIIKTGKTMRKDI